MCKGYGQYPGTCYKVVSSFLSLTPLWYAVKNCCLSAFLEHSCQPLPFLVSSQTLSLRSNQPLLEAYAAYPDLVYHKQVCHKGLRQGRCQNYTYLPSFGAERDIRLPILPIVAFGCRNGNALLSLSVEVNNVSSKYRKCP